MTYFRNDDLLQDLEDLRKHLREMIKTHGNPTMDDDPFGFGYVTALKSFVEIDLNVFIKKYGGKDEAVDDIEVFSVNGMELDEGNENV